eukprot:CAMPEP_0118936486 /NCGR_PEP_ID=MMETSP1169-20130426/19168_1 /TAXON_ID=36882 /ORGANISM="Pyramimonas obovata, Strain CCMP722" /LENGTH=92 /DNA_ID=CAMNT_0006879769 /DNA_START=40 /DNA_END=314 /DNA_ORIENTATION=+
MGVCLQGRVLTQKHLTLLFFRSATAGSAHGLLSKPPPLAHTEGTNPSPSLLSKEEGQVLYDPCKGNVCSTFWQISQAPLPMSAAYSNAAGAP